MGLKDRVEQISALVHDLRQAAGDGRSSRALIDSLFRTVHSFKAAAAAEGRADISNAAHQFEDLLQALRTGELKLDNNLLQVFEAAANRLGDGTDISFAVEKAPSRGPVPAEFAHLRSAERHRVAVAIEEGLNVYVMEAVFEVNDFEARFRELKERLENVAEIISTSPTMKDDKIIFQVVYASQTEKIRVQNVLRQTALTGKSLAANLNKQIEFVLRGEEFLLERAVCEALEDVLLHLVRNAVGHGIDSHGTVLLEAIQDGAHVIITVTDDGRGIAPENLPHVFQPGFTTATEVTNVSGRGVGLDAVKTIVAELGGSVSVTSEPTNGSSFKIIIPNPITTPNPSSGA